MDHFSQISEHSIMTQQVFARLNLSIITFRNVRAAEEINKQCTVNVTVGRN